MKTTWSKEIFAKNLKMYVERSGKTQKELAEIFGVSAPTFHEWLNAKKTPRMGNVQKMADYFGILKSDLIEEKLDPAEQGAFDAAILKNPELMDMIKKYMALDDNKKKAVKQMIDTLSE